MSLSSSPEEGLLCAKDLHCGGRVLGQVGEGPCSPAQEQG